MMSRDVHSKWKRPEGYSAMTSRVVKVDNDHQSGNPLAFGEYKVNKPLHVLLGKIDIQSFLRRFLEDRYSLTGARRQEKNNNRFCVFFAHVLQQITKLSRYKQASSQYSVGWNEELKGLELLLYEALHQINENFELCFDIAYNAEFFIVNLLPKHESVVFYEAMVNASKHHSKRQHGIMLSSLGHVLHVGQARISEANNQYTKALEVLRPLGDSTDLAWLYSHIGSIWFDKGFSKESERYVNRERCVPM